MEPSPSSTKRKPSSYYNAVDFGLDFFLRSHIDKDFTMSIIQVHLDDITYDNNDRILCYFAFPRVGIAVALRPGDFLTFNPQEPHCLSLRCHKSDVVYSISSYLKTQVVGLNDNSNMVI